MASVATVYSKALYGAAKEAGGLDKIGTDLKEFQSLFRVSADLRKALYSSLFDAGTRAKVAEAVAKEIKAQPLSVKFLALLARKNRMAQLGAILDEFNKLRDREAGVVKGDLRTAVDLPAAEIEELAASLSKRVGKRVQLNQERDESLIGGFVANVDGKTFDSSLRTQLRNLKEICTA